MLVGVATNMTLVEEDGGGSAAAWSPYKRGVGTLTKINKEGYPTHI